MSKLYITTHEQDRDRDTVLWAIRKLWRMHPHLRFGQLIDVFSGTCSHSEHCSPLFYKTDKDMADTLTNEINKVLARNFQYQQSFKEGE